MDKLQELKSIIEGLEIVGSYKGSSMLLYQGYNYLFEKEHEDATYWRCKEKTCSTKLKVFEEDLYLNVHHNHPENHPWNKAMSIREKCKDMALTTDKLPKEIIKELTKDLEKDVVDEMPKVLTLERLIQKARAEKRVS